MENKVEIAKDQEGSPISRFLIRGLLIYLMFMFSACRPSIQITSQGDHLMQESGPSIAALGVISDIHGDVERLDHLILKLEQEKVDGILVAGDLVLNEELRYGRPDTLEDEIELQKVVEHLGKAQVPVWVIPGNHEARDTYERVLADQNKVWDLTRFPSLDLKGVNVLSLPGYYIQEQGSYRFLPQNGFFLSQKEIEHLPARMREFQDADPILVLTHGPPLSTLENGIDVVPQVGHTGSEILRNVLLQNHLSFIVFGHIHEAGPQGENGFEKVAESSWTDRLWLNTGAVVDGHAVLLEINGNKTRWKQLNG